MSTNYFTFKIVSFAITAIFVFQPLVVVAPVFAQDGAPGTGDTESGGSPDAEAQEGGFYGGSTPSDETTDKGEQNKDSLGFGSQTTEDSEDVDPETGVAVGVGTIGPQDQDSKTPAEKAGGPNAVSISDPRMFSLRNLE